ncbi:MAG: hypothetical protein AAB653_00275 [Patescibacteria group bacterium]
MKILIIDDDKYLGKVVKEILELEGFDVEECVDIEGIDDLLEKQDFFPDVIILDPFNDFTFGKNINDESRIYTLVKKQIEIIFGKLDSHVKVIVFSAWDIAEQVEKTKNDFPPDTIIKFNNKGIKNLINELRRL